MGFSLLLTKEQFWNGILFNMVAKKVLINSAFVKLQRRDLRKLAAWTFNNFSLYQMQQTVREKWRKLQPWTALNIHPRLPAHFEEAVQVCLLARETITTTTGSHSAVAAGSEAANKYEKDDWSLPRLKMMCSGVLTTAKTLLPQEHIHMLMRANV